MCDKQYCNFVVWTQQGIEEDTNFKEGLFRKLTKFYVDHMLPEIMTHMVVGIDEPINACSGSNRLSDIEEKYCYCQKGEKGKIICCENENCKISWFHFCCLKLK